MLNIVRNRSESFGGIKNYLKLKLVHSINKGVQIRLWKILCLFLVKEIISVNAFSYPSIRNKFNRVEKKGAISSYHI
jgi:hypothetical protein